MNDLDKQNGDSPGKNNALNSTLQPSFFDKVSNCLIYSYMFNDVDYLS